ncbi:hypothetical protein WA026_007436 [Henosepilachna vigintioctopunctata]|uniref:Sulfotransferase domain-containing protein n=1 Tax=Henosepilachna vigintioctopunctata TaxID=420089 RepID=A0AAW1UXP0_9CUCU
MVWLLLNNLDYEKAMRIPLVERYPFLEADCLFHPKFHAELLEENKHSEEKYQSVKKLHESVSSYLDQMTERRFIKSHLPLSLLPKDLLSSGCKVIYIARNPKDLAVSYYHHQRLMRLHGFKNDFQKFWEYFSKNMVLWAPYWDHIFGGWEKRNEKNLLFMFYENIIKDLKKTISDVQCFLGTEFSDEQLSILQDHLQIENFRKNKSVNFIVWDILGIFNKNEEAFIRKGKNGEAINYFEGHLEKEANEWIEKHLKGTDLKFPKF